MPIVSESVSILISHSSVSWTLSCDCGRQMPTLEGNDRRRGGRRLCLPASLAARGAPSAAGCPLLCIQLVLTLRLGAVRQGEGPPLPRLDGLLVQPQLRGGTARVLARQVSEGVPSHGSEGGRVQLWANRAPGGLPMGELRQGVTAADVRGGGLGGGGVGTAQLGCCPSI